MSFGSVTYSSLLSYRRLGLYTADASKRLGWNASELNEIMDCHWGEARNMYLQVEVSSSHRLFTLMLKYFGSYEYLNKYWILEF